MKQMNLMIAAVLIASGSSFAMAKTDKGVGFKANDRNVQVTPQKPKCDAMDQSALLADTNPPVQEAAKAIRAKSGRQ